MNFQEKNFFNNNKISDEDDSIQISNIVSFLFRNKLLVSSLALLGILSGTLSYIFEEKTYEGEFQIVLEEENPMAGSQINSDLKKAQKLFGGKGAGQYLDTEVEYSRKSISINVFLNL